MKVIINGNEDMFIQIEKHGNHWQCNTTGHKSAHNFNSHPKHLPKDKEIRLNGCVYLFPSK
jgi:hypothetical protein